MPNFQKNARPGNRVGWIPHSDGKGSGFILWCMKNKQTKELTFGDLITAAYQVWGTGQAKRMVQFRGQPHLLISSAKGRFV